MSEMPIAFTEQACLISLHGNTVTIECDERQDAKDLFDWLIAVADGGVKSRVLLTLEEAEQHRERILKVIEAHRRGA